MSILTTRIMKHLSGNKLIGPGQQGFMPCESYAANLTVFLDKASKTEKACTIFYLDFAQAFHEIPWKRLTAKLQTGTKGVSSKVVM
jgi:hypothetical protein